MGGLRGELKASADDLTVKPAWLLRRNRAGAKICADAIFRLVALKTVRRRVKIVDSSPQIGRFLPAMALIAPYLPPNPVQPRAFGGKNRSEPKRSGTEGSRNGKKANGQSRVTRWVPQGKRSVQNEVKSNGVSLPVGQERSVKAEGMKKGIPSSQSFYAVSSLMSHRSQLLPSYSPKFLTIIFALAISLCCITIQAAPVVIALEELRATGELAKESAAVNDVLQAELSQSPQIRLVERGKLQAVLEELRLDQLSAAAPDQSRDLQKILGANYFCHGQIRTSGERIMVSAKVVEVETTVTRVAYSFIPKGGDPVEAGQALARKIEETIAAIQQGQMPEKADDPAVVANAREIPAEWRKPSVMVLIPEMHVRQPVLIDPAAQTELEKRLIKAGFKVFDSDFVDAARRKQETMLAKVRDLKSAAEYAAGRHAQILIYGEAISEQGTALGDFVACRARVEVKAINIATSEILLSESAYGSGTDLAETVAGKKAIQNATNTLADECLYPLAEIWQKVGQ